ncbi:MAG TPA: sigma-70 family RNA polymerase sigma factor, partial [Rhizomicrobium sp.]|nr:sigma-70 family RNA polymerase sigma factor [Rhizomicrobium sp.]
IARRQVGGDRQLAEDVTQEVFSTLARKGGGLLDRAALGGWLCRTAQFVARDVVRKERRRRAREQEAVAMDDHFDSGETADPERLGAMLDGAMADLGAEDRSAVWLRYYEQKSFAQIGACLRVKENAARMRVERALEKLRGTLARRGVQASAVTVALLLDEAAGAPAPAGLAASVAAKALAAGGVPYAWVPLYAFMTSKTLIAMAGAAVGASAVVFATNYRASDASVRAESMALPRQGPTTAALQEQNRQLRQSAKESAAEVDALLQAVDQLRASNAREPALPAQPATVSLTGHVINPSLIPLGAVGSNSLAAVIAFAGGMDGAADRHGVRVSRIRTGGGVDVSTLDLAGGSNRPDGNSFTLEPGDIVYVPIRTK